MGQPLIILMEKQYAEENAPFAVEGGCVFIIFPTWSKNIPSLN